jgi:hypothetical protein
VIGGDLDVIANCPACGTHYKHEMPSLPARGRCGRCDTTIDLSRLRPYRVVSARAPRPEDAARAASHSPIGLDDPSLATRIARNVDRPFVRVTPGSADHVTTSAEHVPPNNWASDDPLPPIPEMTTRGMFEPSVAPTTESDILAERAERSAAIDHAPFEEPQPRGGRVTTFALWLVAGAIIGTGASWTLGGTTPTGLAAGAMAGALTGWGWLRWTSPK